MALTTALGPTNITTDVVLASAAAITPFTATGPAVTVTLAAGGTGYTVGDFLTITQAGAVGGTLRVLTLGLSDVVTFSFISGGSGYTVANTLATTVSPSGGTGCTVNITVITPPVEEVVVHSITCGPISTATGAQCGHVSLRDGTTVLWRAYVFFTATAASQAKSVAFPVTAEYRPATSLNVLYTAVTDATTAAVSVVWSRR